MADVQFSHENGAVISHQIRAIADAMGELKTMLKSLDDRMRKHELDEVSYQAINASKLDAAHRRIDENHINLEKMDIRIQKVEEKLPLINDLLEIRTRLIVLVFISGFLGTSVSGMILVMLFEYLFGGFAK